MQTVLRSGVAAAVLALAAAAGAQTPEPVPGASVEGLLQLARQRNPELAAMRHEASAATERVLLWQCRCAGAYRRVSGPGLRDLQ